MVEPQGELIPIPAPIAPLIDDLLVIAGSYERSTNSGGISAAAADDLSFVVRSLCRRVANQALKERTLTKIGGIREPVVTSLMVSCRQLSMPGEFYKSPTLEFHGMKWTFLVEGFSPSESLSVIDVEPVMFNTVWSITAKFQITLDNVNFESDDVQLTFNNSRVEIPWKCSRAPGIIPSTQIRAILGIQVVKVGVRPLPLPDFIYVPPEDANVSIYIEGQYIPVNAQFLMYHCTAIRGIQIIDGKMTLPGVCSISQLRIFLDILTNNAPINESIVSDLLDVSSTLHCVLVRERCEAFLVHTTDVPFPMKLDLATRYKLAMAQSYCLSVIRNMAEIEEARCDPAFGKMCEQAQVAFAAREQAVMLEINSTSQPAPAPVPLTQRQAAPQNGAFPNTNREILNITQVPPSSSTGSFPSAPNTSNSVTSRPPPGRQQGKGPGPIRVETKHGGFYSPNQRNFNNYNNKFKRGGGRPLKF